jgi:hypothetical protein
VQARAHCMHESPVRAPVCAREAESAPAIAPNLELEIGLL